MKELKKQLNKQDKVGAEYSMVKSAINKYYKENSTNFNKTLPYKNTLMLKLSEILNGK